MYYIVIWHDGHLITQRKCRKHEPQLSVFYFSQLFSNVWSVFWQCNTRFRLLHLLYDMEVMGRRTLNHAFSIVYALISLGFLANQSARWVLSILQISTFTSEHRATRHTLKIDHFSVYCHSLSSSWRYFFKLVWYMSNQLFTTVSVNMVDISLTASRLGKYPPLFTSTSVNNS